MTAYPFMRFYFGDYLSKTHSLTTLQHGAYLLLLAAMWGNHGYVKDDDSELARITRLRMRDWKRIRPALEHLLVIENGRITQSRLMEEWTRTAGKSSAAVLRGAMGGRAKATASNNKNDAQFPRENQYRPQHSNHAADNSLKSNNAALAYAKQMLSKRVAKPYSKKDISTSSKDAAREEEPKPPEEKSEPSAAATAPLNGAPPQAEEQREPEPPQGSKAHLLNTPFMQGQTPFLPKQRKVRF